ncbi:MAG: MerR family transcriptional regulator [Aeromicrobium erythreum]
MAEADAVEEFTIDELAARAGMTVRNVRAYAGRGLIDPPRLEGRTGYYDQSHLQRLVLVREFLDRGYTLSAVEDAIAASPRSAPAHALDLLQLLDEPRRQVDPEVMTRDALAALAGVDRDDSLIDGLTAFGLAEWIDDDHDHVRLLQPSIVRAGASAVSLGLEPATIIGLFPEIQGHLRAVADLFVRRVADELVEPFVAAGLPEDQWDPMIDAIERLLPVAQQVTLGIFRAQLVEAIDQEVGEQITEIAERRGDA